MPVATVLYEETTVPKPPHPLRLWREAHGFSQRALARETGLSQGMISHIEVYRHIPQGEALEVLIRITGLHTDALVRPEAFLASHPSFQKRLPRPKPVRRGRPPKLPPPKGKSRG